MKRISFSVNETRYEAINEAAYREGLTVSQYAKQACCVRIAQGGSILQEQPLSRKEANTPAKVMPFLREITGQAQEHFMCLCMNTKLEVIRAKIIFIGTMNSCSCHPREVFKFAIDNMASTIIIAHNHPSGNTLPSFQDFEITKRLVATGKTIGIKVADHMIVGPDGSYYSMAGHNEL